MCKDHFFFVCHLLWLLFKRNINKGSIKNQCLYFTQYKRMSVNIKQLSNIAFVATVNSGFACPPGVSSHSVVRQQGHWGINSRKLPVSLIAQSQRSEDIGRTANTPSTSHCTKAIMRHRLGRFHSGGHSTSKENVESSKDSCRMPNRITRRCSE